MKRGKIGFWAAGLLLLLTMLLCGCEKKEASPAPETGVWTRVAPAGAINADGGEWTGLVRRGSENRVVLCLYGGGVSVNAEMAAHPANSLSGDGFYLTDVVEGMEAHGISSDSPDNPFRDWTMLLVPYTTGDFHCGAGDFAYTGADGQDAVLHHAGLTNLRAYLDEVSAWLEQPEALLITGYSAGGFGAALTTDTVLNEYFPKVENVTVFADSALLLWDGWRNAAQDVWHSPKEIYESLASSNITLDALRALRQKRPDVKILFGCSRRDGMLSLFQNYLSNGVAAADDAAGDVFAASLSVMAAALGELPNTALLLWDELPYGGDNTLTQHTILPYDEFFTAQLSGVTPARWVMDAVEGNLYSVGVGA